jgi:hypothetical protein
MRTIFNTIRTRALGEKKTHLPPARRANVNTRTSAPTPELSRSLTRARFTARSVEPASMSCSAWERKTSSAGPSLSGPSRSRMVIRPAWRVLIFKWPPLYRQKLSESQRLSKRREGAGHVGLALLPFWAGRYIPC